LGRQVGAFPANITRMTSLNPGTPMGENFFAVGDTNLVKTAHVGGWMARSERHAPPPAEARQ